MTPGLAGPLRRSHGRRALVAGFIVATVYAALAAWSGSLSPLGRGPLLDGLGPVNYRWVSPPPGLEATNQPPSAGRFDLPLGKGGVGTQVVFTSDSQVTIVIDDGSIGPSPTQRSVELRVEPVDPVDLAPPGDGLVVFGNAYAVSARFRPSREVVRSLDRPLQMIVLYPATSTLHANDHALLYSPDGTRWEPLESTDSPAQQQVEGDVPGLGYVAVAGVPAQASPSASGSASGGVPAVAVVLLVGAGVVLLIALGLLIRSRAP